MPSKAHFIERMLLLPTEKAAGRIGLAYELKLEGYRAIAYNSGKKLFLESRDDKDFALRYASITNALQELSDGTVIDGESVALNEIGRPAFNALQKYGCAEAPLKRNPAQPRPVNIPQIRSTRHRPIRSDCV